MAKGDALETRLWGAGSILSESSGESNQYLPALVGKEVLLCHGAFSASCTRRYRVSDSWMSDCRLRLLHGLPLC